VPIIESNGLTPLSLAGNSYLIDGSVTVRYNFTTVVPGQFGAWTPIGAEPSGSGYQLVWKNAATNQYIVWTLDGTGNFVSQGAVLAATGSALELLEPTFSQDLNGDGITGAVTTTIESSGLTKLVRIADDFFLYPVAGSSGPQLKMSGANVMAGQFGAWKPIAAEIGSGGYQMVWQNGALDQYIVWNVDSNGNFLSQGAVLSRSSAALQSLEAGFNQDFNGNGITPRVDIESSGSTTLGQSAGVYLLYPTAGGVGPQLKMSGALVMAGQFGLWTALGAEQSGSGYQVVWQYGSADQYVVWNVDGNGNFLSQGAVLSGADVQSFEAAFNQDFNGGGIASRTIIDNFGSTSLAQSGNTYMLYPTAGGVGPQLKMGGALVMPGQFGSWKPLGAEQAPNGVYQVAWQNGSADQFIAWNVDANGNFLSQGGVVSGSTWYVETFESSLQQDLNGDLTVGPVTSTIEVAGSTSLLKVADSFFMNPGSSGPQLLMGGTYVSANQFPGWTPIGAEQIVGGYEIAWNNAANNQYVVWTTDLNGNFLSQGPVMSGSSPALQSYEAGFHQDLNGVGGILSPTTIEAFGAISLARVGSSYLLDGPGGTSGPLLSYGGAYVTAGQFGSWTPLGAEWTGNGYQIAWKMGAADQYTVWTTDIGGNYVSQTAGMFGSSSGLEAYESNLQQDFNGDGLIGIPASTFNISLDYSGGAGNYSSYIMQAAQRWEQVITGDLPDVNNAVYGHIDDVLITVSVGAYDGPGGVLAHSGYDYRRASGTMLPTHGNILIDSADLPGMLSNGTLLSVIEHEIGHVLGFDQRIFALDDLSNSSGFTGSHATFAYQLLSGNSSASAVPLETEGGSGTAGSHWSESVFGTELMTGYTMGLPGQLSTITIGAFQDMGYTVNYSAADPYSMPSHALSVAESSSVGTSTSASALADYADDGGSGAGGTALLTNYMASSFVTPPGQGTGGDVASPAAYEQFLAHPIS
jgi:Tryptophan-rich Synechocystis species C-terminal domain/Leishmanolysin